MEVLEKVLQLYREKYFDFNVQHFHEKLRREHGIGELHVGEDGAAGSGTGERGRSADRTASGGHGGRCRA